MLTPQRKDFLIPLLTVLSDIITIEAAFLFSYWIRFHSPFTNIIEVTQGIPPLDAYIYGSLFVIPVWMLIFNSRKLYGSRRNVYITDEFFAVVRVVAIGMLVVMSATFFYREFSYSRVFFVILFAVAIILITAGRWIVMEIEKRHYRKGKDKRTVLLVGNNQTAQEVMQKIHNHPSLGYSIIGYCADQPVSSFPTAYRGQLKDVQHVIETEGVELVLIALTYQEHPQLYEMIEACQGLNVNFMMVPDLLDLMTSHVRTQELEGIPFIRLKTNPMTTWNRIIKRTFDIVLSLIVLILCLPLFLIIAILIKLGSRGPVFYLQERVGLDGTPFNIIKFRSMRTDAEHKTGPVYAKDRDPRVTRLGGFLRSTSIDELPQLLNVLKGNMSIVGPRPERPYFVEQYKGHIPRYLDRHLVKTGITGWAQVNGLRGNTPIDERTKYDIYYIENWSLVFDIKIILKTLRAVLTHRGTA
jgi:exopolysaccharide biosynthesis polyprenyl glycosylphosphotransferase